MNLTAAEAVLIDFIRGETGSDFHATIATRGGRWHVILSSPSDPVLVGDGASFDAAMTAAVASGSDGPGDGEAAPASHGLRVVAGSDYPERKAA